MNISAAEKKRKRYVLWRDIKTARWLYVMLFPILLHMFIFGYGPMYGIQMAFRNYRLADGIWGSQWVGLAQFRRLFLSPDFLMILTNGLLMNLYLVLVSFPMPILLALLMNEIRSQGYKRSIQTLMYLPHFISWVVVGGIFIAMLSPSTGVVNAVIKFLGFEPIYFMADRFWWRVMFVLSDIWKSAGWGTIIYLAAIAGVDMEQYESARIDGANRVQQAWHITIPCIMPTVSLLLIMRMTGMLNLGFEHVYNLTNSFVRPVSEVFSTYTFRMGIERMEFSYTTAVGLFQTIVNFILLMITNNISGRLGGSTML